jgi:hypothetical protein
MPEMNAAGCNERVKSAATSMVSSGEARKVIVGPARRVAAI